MDNQFLYQFFRNMLFSVPAGYIDIALYELLQQPAPTIVGSMRGVLLQTPPVVLTGPDLHQPELLNPETLNAALEMSPHIDRKIGSLQSIQLNTEQLPPGLVYLFRALLDTYQRMMFTTTDPHSGEKTWLQFIRLIETDSHLKALVEHYLCDDELLSVRHYKRLLNGFIKERSIHTAVQILRKSDSTSVNDNNHLATSSVDSGQEKSSGTLPADEQPGQAISHDENGALTQRTLNALTNIKKASGGR
tara:strand:+ start:1379 stop:2119 length:741 start_codon:yes stop_codon:yes gene_type:complete